MVPFARRARTIRMCSLDARNLRLIQPTLLKTSNKLLRPCLGQGASWRARVGRVRSLALLSILQNCFPVVPHVRITEGLAWKIVFQQTVCTRLVLYGSI